MPAFGQISPPRPVGAVPSERQLAWHALEAYAFVHFSINTFTDREWGYGDESPELFAPTDFSADQIAQTVRDAGLRGLILTAKHHDGFCLWPSRTTDHTIARSPYRDGQGDLVREVSEACARAGLKFGVYLSPWDRNRADYGTPAYLDIYRSQLRELLTGYGPLFEVWFDGANGGDGYYGGARETRRIDNSTYYDWPTTWRMVRELQPGAAMFSDAGPDCRWVGNEQGFAGETCWATINAAGFFPGRADPARLVTGDRGGTHWLPAEVDVSIRPGWFYHAHEDDAVKTPERLFEIYLHSVGRGANLILNLAPDRRGRIPDRDVAALRAWRARRDATFARNLVEGAVVTATHRRGGSDARFAPEQILDANRETYWAADDGITEAALELALPESRTFDLVRVCEPIALGQRIGSVAIDVPDADGTWREVARATSIGAQRLLPLGAPVAARHVRVRVLDAVDCVAVSDVALFLRPPP